MEKLTFDKLVVVGIVLFVAANGWPFCFMPAFW